MATASQPAQLTDIVGGLRRHWPIVALLAGIGLVLGIVVSFAIPAKYSATTTVSVNPMNADPLSSTVDSSRSVSMPTEEGLVTSRKVAAAAADRLRPRYSLSADDVKNATSVQTPEDSLILTVSFSGDTAKQAAAGADAVAEAYLATRRSDASSEVDRLIKTASRQISDIQDQAKEPDYSTPIAQRALRIQADALGTKLAELGNFDLNPGQVVGNAERPSAQSTPGALPLGLAGLFLGLLVGIPVALTRKDEDATEIGSVDGLAVLGDQIVLDGTKDTNRDDTWDIAAFMLKIPTDLDVENPFIIVVDAEAGSGRGVMPGQELIDALSRRGRSARFVDASAINEGKISRGWPTDKKRESWGGEIVVIDTSLISSDANKVAMATRADSLLLVRSTDDDAATLRRHYGLLKSENVEIALAALFPPRTDSISLTR
jgi:capsular polysaccharide biosynthesis protein